MMQALESLKSQGQASLSKLMDTVKEQPDDVKRWGVTAGSAVVGAVAVNAAARGVVAILATLSSTPLALTVGAVGGGYCGWTYLRNRQSRAGSIPIPVTEEVMVASAESSTKVATEPLIAPPQQKETHTVPADTLVKPSTQDDLKAINGIGPVYAGRLHSAGIQTFAQLAELSPDQIRQIIGTERSSHMIEPELWIAEARGLSVGQ